MAITSTYSPPLLPPHHHHHLLLHCKTTTNLDNHHKSPSTHVSKPVIFHSTSLPCSLSQQINNLCNSRDLPQALTVLQENQNTTILETLSSLLHACAQQNDIFTGRKLHEFVCNSKELANNPIISTRIITMYSLCGYPLESLAVFENLETRNLYQWNAVLSGLVKNEMWVDVIILFSEFITLSSFEPDNFTMPCVIKACGRIMDVRLGKCVHGMVEKYGLSDDVFVGNALISMYGDFAVVEEAVKMFEVMDMKNLVTWNSILNVFAENGGFIECFEFFKEMMEGGEALFLDVATMVTMLPVCAEIEDVDMGRSIHCLAVKFRLIEEVKVQNALLDMYSKCGYLFEARMIFEMNENKNVVSWNSMIGDYAREGDVSGAFDLLRKMCGLNEHEKVNDVTVLSVLPVCSGQSKLFGVKELHGYSIRHYFSDNLVMNAFVAGYAKCGDLTSAGRVFDGIQSRSVSCWNALTNGSVQNGEPGKALDLYLAMMDSGINPDSISIATLLVACDRLQILGYGRQIHSFVLRKGIDKDPYIFTSLLSLYIHCDDPLSAELLFRGRKAKGLIAWNAMISGFSHNRMPYEALSLLQQMVSEEIKPDETTIASALCSCSQLSTLRLGKEIHCFALKGGLMGDNYVSCAIIDMYAKCGVIHLSKRFFDLLKEKDTASWTVLISGYGVHGNGKMSVQLYEDMKRSGSRPDGFTFIGVLTACSHAGLVTEGLRYFNEMQSLHRILPKLEHYACVVDMLGRAGKFSEALKLVAKMPQEFVTGISITLLSSCINHGQLDLGKKLAKKMIELEPARVETYVLLSNILAASGEWDEVRSIRGKMKALDLKKDVGCSWIEVGGKNYTFIVGDKSLAEAELIQDIWKRLEKRIRQIGYVPDTSLVLHELPDDEKLEILRGHSEKLAVSFGLLNSPNNVPIKVCKNLRVCGDCHNAIKLVSKVVQRDIILRDNKRFHHFKNGLCSCGDYW
ncbi:hypothetical protein LIER_32238 [Lithospermum erythrorhizon]|uniref:DYW domain-containing protein n=1 Tax=Lithospermum erythrorhizon TaxID=34254 RepID=A0AAV3RWF6_LITER